MATVVLVEGQEELSVRFPAHGTENQAPAEVILSVRELIVRRHAPQTAPPTRGRPRQDCCHCLPCLRVGGYSGR